MSGHHLSAQRASSPPWEWLITAIGRPLRSDSIRIADTTNWVFCWMSPAPVSGSVTVQAAQPILGSSFCQFQLQLTLAVANVPGISRIAPRRAWATLPLQTIAD